jgi:hypothetical protein
MRTSRIKVAIGALALGLMCASVPSASAANTATFRDCSLIAGIDPDFVQLSGVAQDSSGALTVVQGRGDLTLIASESADPGDSFGHVTLSATVTAPGVASVTVSGHATGRVSLAVPFLGAVGSAETITWSATFDNGAHPCPGAFTPVNPMATPFVVHIVASPPPPASAPVFTAVRQSHLVWREPSAPNGSSRRPRPPVGTRLFFTLSEPAKVTFGFAQHLRRRTVSRGLESFAAHAGANQVSFRGQLPSGRQLSPGHYTLSITGVDPSGRHAKSRSLNFTIVR